MSEPIEPSTIRAYCDGELSVEDLERFERLLEADDVLCARVRYERTLRRQVGRSLGGTMAPPDLRARIAEAMADPPADRAADATARRSWLAGPQRVSVLAVAATLALVAGAVLFGIFGPSIDSIRHRSGGGLGGGLVEEAASYASTEHHRCEGEPAAAAGPGFEWTTIDAARAGLGELLGTAVPVADLEPGGYRFLGAGGCRLPDRTVAGRVLYGCGRPGEDGCPEGLMTLVVVPDAGRFRDEMASAEPWRWIVVAEPPFCEKRVAFCTDGALGYFMVCCNDSDLPMLASLIARYAADGE